MTLPEIAMLSSSVLTLITVVSAAYAIPRWVEGRLDKMSDKLEVKFGAINTELKGILDKVNDVREQVVYLSAQAVTKDECHVEHRRLEGEISQLRRE